MDLHDGDEGGVQVVRLGLLAVQDLHGEGPPGDGEDGSLEEVLGELDRVQRGRRHDELQVFALQDRLNAEQSGWRSCLLQVLNNVTAATQQTHVSTPRRSTSVFSDIGDPTQIPEQFGWETNTPAVAAACY